MVLKLADRVKETTQTSGTSDISLGGAVTGFVTFGSVLSDETQLTTRYPMAIIGRLD